MSPTVVRQESVPKKLEATFPEDVQEFIVAHDLEDSLAQALELAERSLPLGSSFNFEIQGDGESDAFYLVIELVVNAARDQLFDRFERFIDAWVEVASKPAQYHICFTYSAARAS